MLHVNSVKERTCDAQVSARSQNKQCAQIKYNALRRLARRHCVVLTLVVVDIWHWKNELNRRSWTSTSASPTVFEIKTGGE